MSIKVIDLNYTYGAGTAFEQHALKHVNFEINDGEFVGLIGHTGSGKSTLVNLIPRFYDVGKGMVLVDGRDVKDYSMKELRSIIGVVPQKAVLFKGSLKDNMRWGKADASDEEICEVLKAACAWEFVEKLPDGIYSMVGERGGGFSEGQAQRLSIARALLRRSPILLLDEATSALDVATERRVLRNIMSTTEPRTCIVTTHRPTVLSICQKVYRIREQKCVQMQEEEIRQMMREF